MNQLILETHDVIDAALIDIRFLAHSLVGTPSTVDVLDMLSIAYAGLLGLEAVEIAAEEVGL